jgi:3-hydroxyacyl-CoA dehydrogenase
MGFVPLNPSYVLLPIKTAAIVGAGTLCGGIAMSFAELGLRVSSSNEPEALDRGIARVRADASYEKLMHG